MGVPSIIQRLKCRDNPFRRRRTARLLWAESVQELHNSFHKIARAQDQARGIRWSSLEWTDEIIFARDRQSGLITAMAGFSVAFEAADLLEDEENATLVREATAVFHFQNRQWGTGGKMLLNMGPRLALTRLGDQFESWEE